jgi:menaquinone-dependent protoporphyrinogen IX oxidase
MIKGIVIYDTSYGNTKKVAETIAETLNQSGMAAEIYDIREARNLRASDCGFLVIGSPTRFGTMSLAMKGFLGRLKGEEWADKPFAAFDTENPENIEKARLQKKEWSAGEKIADKLKEKKMKELLPVLKASVIGMKGPLVEGEVERARKYAMELAGRLGEQSRPIAGLATS